MESFQSKLAHLRRLHRRLACTWPFSMILKTGLIFLSGPVPSRLVCVNNFELGSRWMRNSMDQCGHAPAVLSVMIPFPLDIRNKRWVVICTITVHCISVCIRTGRWGAPGLILVICSWIPSKPAARLRLVLPGNCLMMNLGHYFFGWVSELIYLIERWVWAKFTGSRFEEFCTYLRIAIGLITTGKTFTSTFSPQDRSIWICLKPDLLMSNTWINHSSHIYKLPWWSFTTPRISPYLSGTAFTFHLPFDPTLDSNHHYYHWPDGFWYQLASWGNNKYKSIQCSKYKISDNDFCTPPLRRYNPLSELSRLFST